jgi:site-specific DNA-methyltransferase (cytosine-N4-specific)
VKKQEQLKIFHTTKHGVIYHADSLDVMKSMKSGSLDLIMTSPPFALTRKKEYGNAEEQAYLEWFRPFAKQFHRILKDSGSFVIDLGGAWKPGSPVRSLYHFKLLIMLCEEFGFHLAQEFYWWNPSKLPTPAEWVNIRRVRVKDAINTVWWLSKTEWPRASNRRVLQPYSPSMHSLLEKGYKAKLRPSGHDISDKFSINNGAAIPPNLIAIPNTESNSAYMRYCQEKKINAHPARFPAPLPEYFMRMLTDKGDKVFDPFAGSCVTGEVAERLQRKWVCAELVESYLAGAAGRFKAPSKQSAPKLEDGYYRVPHPGLLWNGEGEPIPTDGGRNRPPATKKAKKEIGRSSAGGYASEPVHIAGRSSGD